MDEDLEYYLKYVKPAEFGSKYYKNPKYFDSDTNQYVAYKDSRGLLTLGPGVLVDNNLLKKLDKKSIKEGDKVDQSIIDTESQNRWRQSVKEAKDIRGQTPSRLPVAEMIYQMGLPSVLKFENTLAQTDPELARQHALDSDWAKQTPNRAREVSARLKESMELEQPTLKERPADIRDLVESMSPSSVDEPYETYARLSEQGMFDIPERQEAPQQDTGGLLGMLRRLIGE